MGRAERAKAEQQRGLGKLTSGMGLSRKEIAGIEPSGTEPTWTEPTGRQSRDIIHESHLQQGDNGDRVNWNSAN